jgi:hypothetical protein
MKRLLITSFLCALLVNHSFSQRMKLGEVLIISNSPLNSEVNGEEAGSYISKMNAAFGKSIPSGSVYLFKADRGDRKGESLLVCTLPKEKDRKALSENLFTDKIFSAENKSLKSFLVKPNAYTEYRMIGAGKFKLRPSISLLGIHYIKVKPERSADFEEFVVEKLHPTVGNVLPDMQLIYYKAVAGENTGSYITIFALESTAARHKYWPEGEPETQELKAAFRPYNDVARRLEPLLVEESYLPADSGGGAAIYESREWTDFLIISK